MILDTFRRVALDPGLNLLPQRMDTTDARVMLTAIALQESALRYRVQVSDSGQPLPKLARGYWQFERGGGVRGVLLHRSTRHTSRTICRELDVEANENAVHEALAWHDTLACCFARLLLWTLPQPLPRDEATGWDQYIQAWRPGKPRPAKWSGNWRRAQEWVTW